MKTKKRISCSKATINLIANAKQISNRCLHPTSRQLTCPPHAATMRSEITPLMPSRPSTIRLYRHLRDLTLSLLIWLIEGAFLHILLARPYLISLKYTKFGIQLIGEQIGIIFSIHLKGFPIIL